MNKFIMTVILSLSGVTAYAYDFYIGDIEYNIISDKKFECEVYSIHGYSFSPYNIVIPSTVKHNGKEYLIVSIGDNAFNGYYGLESITIPNSVTSIGDCAFYGCSNLKSVTLSNSVTSIGNKTFYECSSLESITIPNSVTSIGDEAFYECSSLKSIIIPNSVTSIGDETFYRCSNLKSVIIGTSVQSIGSKAFGNCLSLDKFILLPNTPPSGLNNAFNRYSSDSNTRIKMTYVANDNYSEMENLGTIKKLDYLSSIFEVNGIRYVPVSPSERTCTAIDCTYHPEVKNITINPTVNYRGIEMKVVELNPYTLSCNEAIESIDISTITDIPTRFATKCRGVKTINLNHTGKVGEKAFSYCDSLQSLNIGSTVTNIADHAFAYSMTEIMKGKIILNNTGAIGDYAFYNCEGLQSLEIGSTVTDIEDAAFANSMKKEANGKAVLNNTGTIGKDAFKDCSGLTSAKLSDIISFIGTNAFSGCTQLKEINIPSNITTIEESCFHNCSSLPSITLPENLVSIGKDAFYESGLESIIIPSTTTDIADGAFYQCKALTRFEAQNGEEDLQLGCGKYYDYKDGFGMFAQSPLKEVKIGRNLVYKTSSYYGYSPFYRNTTLETVELTDIPTEVFTNEFYGCSALKKVSIGDGVTKIGDYAFSGCTSLESFSFGASVESIGDEAFSDCTAMTKLYAEPETPPTCGTQALDDINKWNCTLYVPEGATDDYQGAHQWKEFFFIENHDFANGIGNITVTPSKDAVFRIYDLNGVLIRTTQTKPDFNGLPKGIYIVNGKKVYIK